MECLLVSISFWILSCSILSLIVILIISALFLWFSLNSTYIFSNKVLLEILTSVISTLSTHTPQPFNILFNSFLISFLSSYLFDMISSMVELAILCRTIEFVIYWKVWFVFSGFFLLKSSPKLLYALNGPSPSLKTCHIITPCN